MSYTVTIRDTAPIPVAIMSHQGNHATLDATIARFIAWRRANGLHPPDHATYNIFHADPRATPPASYRLDLCVATDRLFTDGEVAAGTLPGGRHAVLRLSGSPDDAAAFLLRDWLPASGETASGHPLYCQRYTPSPLVDLLLPLRPRA